jgi:hypothetical protein
MKKLLYLFVSLALLGLGSCSDDDDDITLQDITVNFASTEVGIDKDNSSEEVAINLSRKSNADIDVTIKLTASDVVYGTDFTTTPAAADNTIKVSIPAGNTTASFTVSKVEDALFEGTETVKFEITALSVTSGVKIGDKKEATLTFGAILSNGGTQTLEGKSGDVAYANSVYVDFSSNTQVAINRKNWDLGFYCGDDFRVVLNPAFATTATASTKTDITAVTIEDANAAIDIAATPMSDDGLSINVIDSFDGALTGTVFAAVSATESENKVYFVASEDNKTSRGQWYKVKVTRNGTGYKVQYAKVSETTIKTVEVSKNADNNFTFLSLTTGTVVSVEPAAKKWDIMWSYYVGSTMGKPYFMQDMVITNNVGGAEAVEVLTSTVTYDNFKAANLTGLEFSKARNVIANNWRVTANMGGATGAIGIKADRFYVVKDPNGNYYKLRFLRMGLNNDGGERGRPVVEYELLK